MHLSRATQYAILSMAQLKPDGEPIPCSTLAKKGEMPPRFLLQVLRSLVNAGLLKATRGVAGGYRLAKPAKQITVAEIVEAIEGPIVAGRPTELAHLSKGADLVVQGTLGDGVQLYRGVLSRLKLSQLSVA